MRFRSLFFGTPAFAVPSLDALAEISDVVGVVCQPDKPAGRGMTLHPPPVKTRAIELGIPVVQPTKLRTGEFGLWVRSQNADVALVIAYGRILPKDVLESTRLGFVNVHASLLPKYRGAAPITWAVVRGETQSGVTLMVLDEGMDTGAMLEPFAIAIGPNETAGELSERIAVLGAEATRAGLPRYVSGGYTPIAQDDAGASMAPMLKKEDGVIDFTKTAREVHDHVRGMSPWPGAQTKLHGKIVKVHATTLARLIADPAKTGASPGEVLVADKSHLLVTCGEGAIEMMTVQLDGKKPMRGVDWVMGRGVHEKDRFGA